MDKLEKIYTLVEDGYLAIKKDGSIWRMKSDFRPNLVPRKFIWRTPKGYAQISVSFHSKVLHIVAHRLVYRHHFGPIPPELQINHKNGVKDDNRISNLELVTQSENIQHAMHELGVDYGKSNVGEDNKNSILRADEVREIKQYLSIDISQADVAREFCISSSAISCISRGKTWKHIPWPEDIVGQTNPPH